MRGYAAIGLFHTKFTENIGGVLRAAACFGAALVVVQGRRYKRQSTDTSCAHHEIPLLNGELLSHIPLDCVPVAVELKDNARTLPTYIHPERAFYIFGPEDGSVSNEICKRCRDIIQIPSRYCLNLAAAANVVLYDRCLKQGMAQCF